MTRNIHGRTEAEINGLNRGWEATPSHMNRIDLRAFLQEGDGAIQDVDMDMGEEEKEEEEVGKWGRSQEEVRGGAWERGQQQQGWW